MIKKQRIDSKLSVSTLKKSEQIELHVLVANNATWRPENWQAYDRGSSISIGFIKADIDTALFDLRSIMIQQLRPESLPDQYVYLRHVGRGSTVCSARQERSLKARDFAPPFYSHAEICILSAENMVFHPRYRNDTSNMLPAIITSEHSPTKRQNISLNSQQMPPVTPARLGLNNTAPLPALDRSKSPSFRSLQSLDGSAFSVQQNNELMMAEIQFLEAKRALAEAHAQALRNQFLMNQSVIIENGLNSEGGSEDGTDDEKLNDEEDEEEKRRREEEEMLEKEKRERERIRKEEDAERQRLLAMEDEKRRKSEEEKKRREQEIKDREAQIEAEIKAEEAKARALYEEKRKQEEEKHQAELDRLAELQRAAKEEEKRREEERRKREEEEERIRREAAENAKRREEEEEELKRQEELLKEEGRRDSDDDEVDAAMKLIDDLTQSPRPWQAVKDPNKKKIVNEHSLEKMQRVPMEYSKEDMEEVGYLRAKITDYRTQRKQMETKHHDLLIRLAEMEQNWNDDEVEEFESKWRPKCKEEEKKTPQLYERNRLLRLELQMLYKQSDTIITHAQAKKNIDDRKGMAFPSIKNNLRINLQRLQSEVTELRKRAATANIKYEAEKSNREGVEKEVKQLRQELINSKISSSVSSRR